MKNLAITKACAITAITPMILTTTVVILRLYYKPVDLIESMLMCYFLWVGIKSIYVNFMSGMKILLEGNKGDS